jgi:hypothetical protein
MDSSNQNYWDHFARTCSTTPEFILARRDVYWDWSELSFNPNVLALVDAFPHMPWNWDIIAMHCGGTPEFLEKYKLHKK